MKKIIFGIFAHPDDEAFGPAGTLLMETNNGTELHLITLTAGENGTNPDNRANLGTVRLQEWQKAAGLIGAAKTYHLGFIDGHLDNIAMIKAVAQIEEIVASVVPTSNDLAEVEFMTLDPNGMTGHIDHIVACRAACLVFYRHKAKDARFTKIRFACLPYEQYPTIQTDWIYMEAGRQSDAIDERVDARHLRNEIMTIMRCHDSQRADCEATLASQGDELGLNYFMVAR